MHKFHEHACKWESSFPSTYKGLSFDTEFNEKYGGRNQQRQVHHFYTIISNIAAYMFKPKNNKTEKKQPLFLSPQNFSDDKNKKYI